MAAERVAQDRPERVAAVALAPVQVDAGAVVVPSAPARTFGRVIVATAAGPPGFIALVIVASSSALAANGASAGRAGARPDDSRAADGTSRPSTRDPERSTGSDQKGTPDAVDSSPEGRHAHHHCSCCDHDDDDEHHQRDHSGR